MPRYIKINNWTRKEIGLWYVIGIKSSYQVAKKFADVLSIAVPGKVDTTPVKSSNGNRDWSIKISRDLSAEDRQKLNDLFPHLMNCIHIEDYLTHSYALDTHMDPDTGYRYRTEIGNMVNRAKSYNIFDTGDKEVGRQLAERLYYFITGHPIISRVDIITCPPGSNKRKWFDLPDLMVGYISQWTGIPYYKVKKIRDTRPLKDCTFEEKQEIIRGAFVFDNNIWGKSVLVIDDLYDEGATINELALTAFNNGASFVYGLCCTKTKG